MSPKNASAIPARRYHTSHIPNNSLPLPRQAHWTTIWSQRWGPESAGPLPAKNERTKERHSCISCNGSLTGNSTEWQLIILVPLSDFRSLLLSKAFLTSVSKEIQQVLTMKCLNINRKVQVACNINCLIKTEGLLLCIPGWSVACTVEFSCWVFYWGCIYWCSCLC